MPLVSFYTPLKISQNLCVFRGYRKRPVSWNGFTLSCIMLTNGQTYFKILLYSYHKIFKVSLTIFQYYVQFNCMILQKMLWEEIMTQFIKHYLFLPMFIFCFQFTLLFVSCPKINTKLLKTFLNLKNYQCGISFLSP